MTDSLSTGTALVPTSGPGQSGRAVAIRAVRSRPTARRARALLRAVAVAFALAGTAGVLHGVPGVADVARRAEMSALPAPSGVATPDPVAEMVRTAGPALAAPDGPVRGISNLREAQASGGGGDCAVTVTTLPLAGAIVALEIDAPCDGGGRVDLIEGDLRVAVSLDDEGRATVEMPALSAQPTFAALVEGREPVTLRGEVLDFDRFRRVTLFWGGPVQAELHGFEGGAEWGDPGHVRPDAPGGAARGLSERGGWLSALGDASLDMAHRALVYSWPVGIDSEISVELPLTGAGCGEALTGGAIRSGPGAAPETVELSLTLPPCDGPGEVLVLGDVFAPAAG